MSNRKLIRAPLSSATTTPRPRGEASPSRSAAIPLGRKGAPPEQTNAETFYYLKQMGAKTPMIVVTMDGEILRGWIEWYDKLCVKLNREHGPNLLLMKHAIKYMYKEEEERGSDRRRRRELEKTQLKDLKVRKAKVDEDESAPAPTAE